MTRNNTVFISHSHMKSFVRRLAGDLAKTGITCWVDEAEMQIGDSLLQKIHDGISRAGYLAAVLSRHSVKSTWVRRELEAAITEELESGGVKVLPLLLSDCELPRFLRGRLYADFRTNYEVGLVTLLNRLAPKQFADLGASAPAQSSGGTPVVVYYKNERDRPALRLRLEMYSSFLEIRRANPRGLELFANIHLDGVPRLEKIDVLDLGRRRGTRLTFNMSIDDLNRCGSANETWRDMAGDLEDALWARDERLAALLESQQFAVVWGGPDTGPHAWPAEATYYLDGQISFLWFSRVYKRRAELDDKRLGDLYRTSKALGTALDEIIEQVKRKYAASS